MKKKMQRKLQLANNHLKKGSFSNPSLVNNELLFAYGLYLLILQLHFLKYFFSNQVNYRKKIMKRKKNAIGIQ